MREAYAAINATSANPKLVALANRAIFEHLHADALLFLCGIWTLPSSSAKYNLNTVKYVALRHALAFLRAQSTGVVDFQTVLPAFLVALQSTDRQVRSAAVECVDVLANVEEGAKPASIYALDRVYGTASGESYEEVILSLLLTTANLADLQYVDWSDTCKYLHTIKDHSDHLRNDEGYIAVLHHDYLSHTKSQGKKEAK